MAGMANWQAQISIDIDDLKKRIKVAEGELDKIEKKEHKVKLDIDTKTLENAISKLDRMLESLGKGSGDFKEFENLSKQLSSIATDINNISKAFSVMNDGSDFANIIKSIDASLTALSNHFVSEMSGRMTSSIKEVKSTLSDIGDGGELAPLLQIINKIENAINELSASIKGIRLNMNIDVGSDSEMEAKVQSKIANALQAYQRLFDHIKMSSVGSSVINNFFEFEINQYDTMMGKLQAYKKFIDNMRKEAKAQFNGKDVLYQNTEKSYWTQASAAMSQVTKAFNEMNASSDVNPLADMFGKTDLSGVISQLGLIVAKLEEISTTASSFKNVFANGFNVTSSVEEINKLTNRVKELEDELSKIKLNPVGVDKSNIPSGIEDVFQGDDKAVTDASTTAIKEESKALEQVSDSAKEASESKEKFAKSNKEVKASADSSKASISEEEKYFNSLGKSLGQYQNTLTSISRKPADGNRSKELQDRIDTISSSLDELRTLESNANKDGYVFNKEDVKRGQQLEKIIKDNIEAVKQMSAAQKGSTPLSRGKTIEWANDLLKKNTKWSKAAKNEVKGWIDKLASADPSNVEEIRNEILKVVRAEREAGREGKSFFDIFKSKVVHRFASQLAMYYLSFYDFIRYTRNAINAVKEFDEGLTKISYTMDMTKSQLDNLGKSVLNMASDMKSSIDDAMQVAQIYANMQTSAEEIQRLSEPTLILSNLSGFDSSTIADDIQAVTQQFDILAEDSMHIADVYDYISRNIAVDYSKGLNAMAEGLQVAGSTAKQAGLSYEQTASIIAKAVEKTRLEGSQVGNGLKTIMTRLSKVGELSEEVDNETLSQASESLKKVGIEVYNLDGSYREFDVIMGELANKWDDLTDAEKSNISFNIAA